MANKPKQTVQKIDAPDPKRLDECMFFSRLGFELSEEQKKFRDAIYDPNVRMVMCNAKAGSGKAQPKDTIIPTPEGEKKLGDLQVGDFVFGKDGKPTKILGIFDQGYLDAYKITFTDGRSTICNGEHLWTYYSDTTAFLVTETLNSMLQRNIYTGNRKSSRYAVPLCDAVEYPEKQYEIDPYVMGVLLGDGCCLEKRLTISSSDEELIKEVCNICGFASYKRACEKNYNWIFIDTEGKSVITKKFLANFSEIMCHSYEKRIPEQYFYGSIEQRFSLLQGLMDTDGGIDYACGRYNVRFSTVCAGLKDDIIRLVRGLGYTASVREDRRQNKYPNTGVCYGIYFKVPNSAKTKLFRLSRKKEKATQAKATDKRRKYDRLGISLVEKLPDKYDMRCIYVENSDHLYLTNDFIVTHNTTIAVATACLMVECGLYDNIFYCFSTNNGARESLGFLPGTIEEKEQSFYDPCLQALVACGYDPQKVVKELNPEGDKAGTTFVSCRSHAFLRGTNIDDHTILILDETQNNYWDEIKKILTRIKDGAKVIMIGHVGQIDIQKHPENSGFRAYINLFKNDPAVRVCQLTKNFRGHISEVADTMNTEMFKMLSRERLPFEEE